MDSKIGWRWLGHGWACNSVLTTLMLAMVGVPYNSEIWYVPLACLGVALYSWYRSTGAE